MQPKTYGIFSLPVIVGALGFFVDIYDLLLFNIVRKSSFRDLGVADDAMKDLGESIISWQMFGLTVVGICPPLLVFFTNSFRCQKELLKITPRIGAFGS